MAGARCLKVAALADYGGAFAESKACASLRAAGHFITSTCEPINDTDTLVLQLQGCDAALLTQQRTSISREALAQLPKLKWVLNTGRNFGHLDADALKEHGVTVVGGGGSSPNSPAEMTWALILASQRNLVPEAASVQRGGWQSMSAGLTLQGKTLGVYGLGGIGSIVASIGSVLGMRVIVCGRGGTAEKAAAMGYEVVTREELFEKADVLTLHLKLNAATTGIVTGSDLARMKAEALFVNTSRAELLEPGALVSALQKGRPSRAALDVFEQEPLPAGHSLLGMPNVLLTPHLGYVTDAALERYYDEVVQEFLAKV